VAALNAGLACCRAPVIARMDADDVCHPRRLELQLAALECDPDVGVVSCGVRFFPRSRVAQGFRIYEDWLNSMRIHDEMSRERFVESPVVHPSVMLRRELLEGTGGYRDLGWPEDFDLWLRLFETGARFAKVDRPLYFWREHEHRLTRKDARYSTDAFLRCKAHHLLRGPLREADRVVIWGAGRTGRRLSRHLSADGMRIEAFVDIDPVKIGRTLSSRPIVSPEDLPGLLQPGTATLAAVASRGARDLIRQRLDALDLVEGDDYWCVA
jgi:glycosyltransferase involved in cell wall biosynthesis